MPDPAVLCNLDERGVARVTLNRPNVGNAYNGDVIGGLLGAMDDLARKRGLRAVLLSATALPPAPTWRGSARSVQPP
jgi:methylglutaconyl-CoA hydratase